MLKVMNAFVLNGNTFIVTMIVTSVTKLMSIKLIFRDVEKLVNYPVNTGVFLIVNQQRLYHASNSRSLFGTHHCPTSGLCIIPNGITTIHS